ncbi:MAG TPA: GNAT family N-acetyltransferase [Flexivirga sp.]|uniref:GNAT family N-acetyltransferase n=1 Tax=Flexivirga sp. TaxID=1962927 RepID=UPI002C2FF80E|nr:GNAT family N-acetyltransferase [Flexivirga sp.]HWC22041.1 GNAT family N-acetyltransferase [Flexivirga sp.]
MSDTILRCLPGSALHELFPDDPFLRWDLARPHLSDIWVYGDSVGFQRHSHSRHIHGLSLIGRDNVPQLLDAVLADLPPEINGLALERRFLPVLQDRLGTRLGAGGDWDWMWTEQPPPHIAAEDLLVELDDLADAADIIALNAVGNPSAESEPGTGRTRLWLGVRRADELVAAGAMHRTPGGAPHLAGIVVHPRLRGRGLGVAVTAGLTRRAIADYGVCTLGMYADNDRARAMYEGLGFAVARAWASRRLLPADGARQ